MQCTVAPALLSAWQDQIRTDLSRVYSSQTAPFIDVYQDHLGCLKQLRELQVPTRNSTLCKLGAEVGCLMTVDNLACVLLFGVVPLLPGARVTAGQGGR